MVNIYEEFRADTGFRISGRTKLFIINTLEDGSIEKYKSGVSFTAEGNGTQFIVDDWLIPQLGKVKFLDGILSVKDGEELIPPVKTDKQKEMEELQRRMAELQALPDEPTDIGENAEPPVEVPTDTEEQTDAPLLDYTDAPAK